MKTIVVEYAPEKETYIIVEWYGLPEINSGTKIYFNGNENILMCSYPFPREDFYIFDCILEKIKVFNSELHTKAFENFIESMHKAKYEYIDG